MQLDHRTTVYTSLIGMYLTGVHLTGVHLTGVYLTGVYLMRVSHKRVLYLTGVHVMGVHLIYESSLRAGHGWRESLYRRRGCLKLLIMGDSAVRLLVTLGARSAW